MYASAAHTAVAAGSAGIASYPLAFLVVLPVLALIALVISALVSIVTSPYELGMKLVWVVLVLALPFIGSLLWFLIGRGHARRVVAH